MVLIKEKANTVLEYKTMFPSPCGDYGSYPKRSCVESWELNNRFPSPCGDYGSYLTQRELSSKVGVSVSVPLRGLWFLSKRLFGNCAATLAVSVPLRGLWFLSHMNGCDGCFEDQQWFPSPCGDYGSYLDEDENEDEYRLVCFRPLAGIMVLISVIVLATTMIIREFPSPCGDYGSYQQLP